MRVVTEEKVKRIILAGKMVVDGQLWIPSDCILTPAAMDVITNARLILRRSGKSSGTNSSSGGPDSKMALPEDESPQSSCKSHRYKVKGGGCVDVKPEHMTHLHGNELVPKDDPRIRLRGEVDLLIAEILKVQIRAKALSCQQLVDDLEDVYGFVGSLMRCEITEEPFTPTTVNGLVYDEIREVSHNPKRFFGRGHLFDLSYEDGELTVLLNGLRAQARRCELTFYEAFKNDDGTVLRPDLMEGYNRLSSLLYILCMRATTEQYGGVK